MIMLERPVVQTRPGSVQARRIEPAAAVVIVAAAGDSNGRGSSFEANLHAFPLFCRLRVYSSAAWGT
ncbi:hypothetical protein LINPERHAP2_LOCUS14062, partial [Linum perenne]